MSDHKPSLLPLNLYLIRHGETEGNVNRDKYITKPDHAMNLTPKGIDQARDAACFLSGHLLKDAALYGTENFGKIRVWHSSYYRARQTASYILNRLGKDFDKDSGIVSYLDDPFLIEQKAGLYDGLSDDQFEIHFPKEAKDYQKHLQYMGRAYAMTPLGDSRLDLVRSVKPFFGSILRDYHTHNIRHVVVVSHGVTLRAEVMGWMRYPPEWMDAERNPGNCWMRHISGTRGTGYKDFGYIFGEGAPLLQPTATQKHLPEAEKVFMLKPYRSNCIVPPGVKLVDPFTFE